MPSCFAALPRLLGRQPALRPARWRGDARRVDELADAVDGAAHKIAWLEIDWRLAETAHPFRCAGRDEISWLQGREPRDMRDDLGHRGNHIRCCAILLEAIVDSEPQMQRLRVGQLIRRDDSRPYRAERIEILATRPLPLAKLQIAG